MGSNSKLSKFIVIIGGIASIFAIVAFFIDYYGVKHHEEPVAEIQEQSYSIDYLSNLGDRNNSGNKFPLFNDIIDTTKEYKTIDNCATQILVTNDYDKPILINKIIFEAKEIKEETGAVLYIDIRPSQDGESGGSIFCSNQGEEESDELTLKLSSESLDGFFSEDKQTITIPPIKPNEYSYIELWHDSDLINKEYDGVLEIKAECTDKDGNEFPILYEFNNCLYASISNGQVSTIGGFGPSEGIYGVRIDTSSKNYRKEFDVAENVEGNNRLELPICFYADKTCSLKFRVVLEIIYGNDNRKKNISTDWAEIKFHVSSNASEWLHDVTEYNSSEIEKLSKSLGIVKITYPAVERKKLENIGPIR
nr:MAG TPA: hypothetical protein [Caudoviricetes sp.]